MGEFGTEQAIAERYFEDMLHAERDHDYAAWCRHWLSDDIPVTEAVFQADVEAMDKALGAYQRREYLGGLRGRKDEVAVSGDKETRLRFVWRVIYERNEALFIVGLRKVDDRWFVYDNACTL